MKGSWQDERGQQLVLTAVLLVALMGMLALVVDLGLAYIHHRLSQNAADSAAMAGAMVLCDQSLGNAQVDALDYAERHGYTASQVTVEPGTGYGFEQYLTVTISDNSPTLFARLFGQGTPFSLVTAATAGCRMSTKGPPVLILNRSDCNSLRANSSLLAIWNVDNGNVHVNSFCGTAASFGGLLGLLNTDTRTTIVGGYSSGLWGFRPDDPLTGALYEEDPLRGMLEPVLPNPMPIISDTVNYCGPYYNENAAHVRSAYTPTTTNPNLKPGWYPYGLDLTGGAFYSNLAVGTGPCQGLYYIGGNPDHLPAALKIGGANLVTAQNVMFFFGGDDANGNQGYMDVDGLLIQLMTPPQTGPYSGIQWFQARRNSHPDTINGLIVSASAAANRLTGVTYLPAATLTISGVGFTSTTLIVDKFSMSFTGVVTMHGYEGPGWRQSRAALVK
jgi:Flp pilus assembly protein TadG